MSEQYAGAGWIQKSLRYDGHMSSLGKDVANLLGDLFYGIYHMNMTSLRKVDWSNKTWIEVTVYGELATYDFDGLTRLVILCHDRAIRCSVEGLAPGYVRLIFHRRKHGPTEHRHEFHPTLEDNVRRIRKDYEAGE